MKHYAPGWKTSLRNSSIPAPKSIRRCDVLSGSQKKYLRGLAHHLNPSVRVGKKGIAESLIESVDSQLKAHELIKVKFVNWKERKESLSDQIATETQSENVG